MTSAIGSQSPPADDATAGGGPPGLPPDEFAGIPSRSTRHPALIAAAVTLAGFLIFQNRSDILYALSSAAPVNLGDARTAFGAGSRADLPSNRYATVSGVGDRESALILDTQGSWSFNQFFRLLGTSDRVFIKRVADPLPIALAEHDVFTGRLVPFHELSFQESIRRHFSSHVSATHLFTTAALEAALSSGKAPLSLPDRLGQPVTLAPEDELVIETARPGETLIELPLDRFPDLARVRTSLTKRGAEVLSVDKTEMQRVAVLAKFADATRATALAAIADMDPAIRIGPARTTTHVRVADLTVAGNGFVAGSKDGQTPLARAAVLAIRSVAPVRIPENAWLLIEGDQPRDHLRTVVIAIFLIGFALVNLLGLRRSA